MTDPDPAINELETAETLHPIYRLLFVAVGLTFLFFAIAKAYFATPPLSAFIHHSHTLQIGKSFQASLAPLVPEFERAILDGNNLVDTQSTKAIQYGSIHQWLAWSGIGVTAVITLLGAISTTWKDIGKERNAKRALLPIAVLGVISATLQTVSTQLAEQEKQLTKIVFTVHDACTSARSEFSQSADEAAGRTAIDKLQRVLLSAKLGKIDAP
jgi:hypothetical protein